MRIALIFGLSAVLAACSSVPRAESVSRPVLGPPPVRSVSAQPRTQVDGTPPLSLTQSVTALVRGFNGRVGIAIARSDASWTLANYGNDLFPQQSVSKIWVALAVMDAVDRGQMSLSDPVTVTQRDRAVFNQPIMQYVDGKNGYQSSIGDLLRFQMILSDNAANDILLRKVGGPEAVKRFIAARGLGSIRFGPGEKHLQAGTAGLVWQDDYAEGRAFQAARAKLPLETRKAAFDRYVADPVDGASPVAIARALLKLKKGSLLTRSSTQHLLGLMAESKTGPERLKAGVPFGWQFAHKTGTGQDLNGTTAGYNDIALLTAPDGTSYAVVVLMGPVSAGVPDRKAFMQAVAASVGASHSSIAGRSASR